MITIISQIFLSDFSEELPDFLVDATSSFKVCFDSPQHKIYNNKQLRNFIETNYTADVLWAFDSLKPYSYKSDLGRFCLLYKLGGWYFDIAVKCLRGLNVPENIDMICFRDEQRHSKTSWAVNGAVIWSKPGNKILRTAITGIVKRVQHVKESIENAE